MQAQIIERGPVFPFEKRAVSAAEFKGVCIGLIPGIYASHEARFGPGSENVQVLHRKDLHLRRVVARVARMIGVARRVDPDFLSLEQAGRALFFAAGHDLVQNFKVKDKGVREERVRDRSVTGLDPEKGNEMKTVGKVNERMVEVNNSYGKLVFVQGDVDILAAALAATIPTWDSALRTVAQPFLRRGIPIEAALVGLADLGGAGMDGPKQFKEEGNAEFQEVMMGITRAVADAPTHPRGLLGLSNADRVFIRDRIINWLENVQPQFAEGRKQRLEEDLLSIDHQGVREAFRVEVFNRFDESISSATNIACDLGKKTLAELLVLIGYLQPKKARF